MKLGISCKTEKPKNLFELWWLADLSARSAWLH